MGWDDVSLFTLQVQPTLAALWFCQFLLHASFSLSSENLFRNTADFFCFRIQLILPWILPLPRLNAAYHLGGAVDVPGQEAELMPTACPSQSLQDFGHSFLWRWCKCWKLSPELNCKRIREFTSVVKQIIIIGKRLSNCVCNHFLLKILVHLRRETSWYLCKNSVMMIYH